MYVIKCENKWIVEKKWNINRKIINKSEKWSNKPNSINQLTNSPVWVDVGMLEHKNTEIRRTEGYKLNTAI